MCWYLADFGLVWQGIFAGVLGCLVSSGRWACLRPCWQPCSLSALSCSVWWCHLAIKGNRHVRPLRLWIIGLFMSYESLNPLCERWANEGQVNGAFQFLYALQNPQRRVNIMDLNSGLRLHLTKENWAMCFFYTDGYGSKSPYRHMTRRSYYTLINSNNCMKKTSTYYETHMWRRII